MVLRNQLDILKPAGWIQLVEVEWIDPKNPHSLPELYKCSLMQEWSTKSFGMDINIAYKLEALLESAGFTNIQKVQFRHGYGPLAHSLIQKDASVELYVECFRSLDAKMPPGMWFAGFNSLKSFLLFLHHSFFDPTIEKKAITDSILLNRWHPWRGKDSSGIPQLLGSLGVRDQGVWLPAETRFCFCAKSVERKNCPSAIKA